MVVAAVVALAGALGLVVPFLPIGHEWRWMLTAPADLDGASVNAQIVSIDARGLQIVPQGQRPISVITPPLSLPSSAPNTLAVEVSSTQVTAEIRPPTPVRLLWQTQAAEAYRFIESQVVLSGTASRVLFSLPDSPEKIHRLGIQFSAWQEPLVITKFELPRLSLTQKLGAFAEEASRREPLANHSINFVRGPVALGHGFNYWLVSILLAALGWYAWSRLRGGKTISWRVPAGIAIAVWLLGDLQATANLHRSVFLEVKQFSGRSSLEQIELAEGSDIAWAYEQILEHCPIGGTYAVISDDPFTPAHRLDYRLAPFRIRKSILDAPHLVLVIQSSASSFDPPSGRLSLSLENGPSMVLSGEVIASMGDRLYLFKRELTAGASASPLDDGPAAETPGNQFEKRARSTGSYRVVWILLAVSAPWCVGMILLPLVHHRPLRPLFDMAIGFLVGQLIIMVLVYLAFVLTGSSQARSINVILAITAATLWISYFTLRTHPRKGDSTIQATPPSSRRTPYFRFLLLLMAFSLFSRLVLMIAATAFVPIRGDDAISIWLYRANVIASTDQLSFNLASDYYLGGSIPGYPVFVSLIAAWIPLIVGGWTEPLAVLWWPLWYLMLVLITAVGLRRWLPPTDAFVVAFVVASLPLLGIHVCRPGYADLPLAVFLAAAVLYGMHWRETGRFADLLFFLLLTLATACTKREGPVLAAIVFLGFAVTSRATILSMTTRARSLGGIALLVGLTWCVLVLDYGEQRASLSQLSWHPEVMGSLIRHAFEWSSFNLGFWLILALLPVVAFYSGAMERWPALLISLGLLGFVAAVFLLTPQARFAVNDQTPSRLLLQVAPAIILLMARSLAPLFQHQCPTHAATPGAS